MVEDRKTAVPVSSTAQQSDNIAHALAGAGGGLLSMTLTYVCSLHPKETQHLAEAFH